MARDVITAAVFNLFHDLERGGRAITSSHRLGRQLAQRFADWKIGKGASAWPAPYIREYEDWLVEIWQVAFQYETDLPRLLSKDQELLLWEQVIRRQNAGDNRQYLLQLSGTARAAQQTWRRIHDWRLDWKDLKANTSADTKAFLRWADAVQEILRDKRWLTVAQLSQFLVDHHATWLESQKQPVWWVGFDELPAAHDRFIVLLRDKGLRQNRYTNAGIEDADVAVVECTDAEDEWTRIARWARAALTTNPHCSLGVVCPDLQDRRDDIEEIFEDVLHPELAWRVDAPRAYHLSLGRPLPEYPIIQTALDLLQWTAQEIPFKTISRTLRSPYLNGGETELEVRIEFELTLRDKQRETFTPTSLGTLVGRHTGLERFDSLLGSVFTLQLPEHADPGTWAAWFSDWLYAFGWPGERSLDSHDFQIVNAWREQLVRFAALNAIQSRWTRAEALKRLSAMTSSRILQFHDEQAPLQIMGAPEASSLWFDKMWLADMSDAVWPPSTRPDPFIPVSLQKACGIPRASAQSVLVHTRTRTNNLLANAGQIRISYASSDVAVPVDLSPLFGGIPTIGNNGNDGYGGRVAHLIRSRIRPEFIADHHAPALYTERLRGGVHVLADQARCPFRALTHHRLRVREMLEVSPGLHAMDRGNLVHEAARRLWERLENHETLIAMNEASIRSVISDCVANALQCQFVDSAFKKQFLEIERERLQALLVEWLALETQRNRFRVVGTEIDAQVDLGGVRFDIRVDRIDELDSGGRLIIDYKTGRLAKIADWADPRMEEPQLPMYALRFGDKLAGLALAGIRRGGCEFRGIADKAGDISFLEPVSELDFKSMNHLKTSWASILSELVGEYRRGVARVDPKSPQTCRHCDAMSLCRIFERAKEFSQ
ncbi:MAG: ATP-dependent helicase/deoxyribonuclease subunit B [Gammaproteobacteria bacterium]|nr:ATP-dependent helicase/deoxyribonuclease subunit B [Gammaproteobacteria bacterium]